MNSCIHTNINYTHTQAYCNFKTSCLVPWFGYRLPWSINLDYPDCCFINCWVISCTCGPNQSVMLVPGLVGSGGKRRGEVSGVVERVLFAGDQWRGASGMAVTGSLERRPVITSSVHASRNGVTPPNPINMITCMCFTPLCVMLLVSVYICMSLCKIMLPT